MAPVQQKIVFNGQPVMVVRKAHRKRLSCLVKPTGEVVLQVKMQTSGTVIQQLLSEWWPWINQRLEKAKRLTADFKPIRYLDGDQIPYFGRLYTLQTQIASDGLMSIQFDAQKNVCLINLPAKNQKMPPLELQKLKERLLKLYLRKKAQQFMAQRLQFWQERMQLHCRRVSFRAQRTLWGSCTAKGDISLNLKLIVFPEECIDYVIIHELSHLQHRDHSKNFWALVAKFDPNYKSRQKWISTHQFHADFLSQTINSAPQ